MSLMLRRAWRILDNLRLFAPVAKVGWTSAPITVLDCSAANEMLPAAPRTTFAFAPKFEGRIMGRCELRRERLGASRTFDATDPRVVGFSVYKFRNSAPLGQHSAEQIPPLARTPPTNYTQCLSHASSTNRSTPSLISTASSMRRSPLAPMTTTVKSRGGTHRKGP